MEQKIFTREEVIFVINELLEMPDTLVDAVSNENTDNKAELLLILSTEHNDDKLKNGQSIFNDLVLISSIDAKSKEGKFCKNISKMSIANL